MSQSPQSSPPGSPFLILNSRFLIRLAVPPDALAIQRIYAPYVLNTVITFDTAVPKVPQLEVLITHTLQRLPWLVAEVDGRLVGYALATPHRERAAYRWNVDSSIYLHPDFHGAGVAPALYTALFDLLRRQGYVRCYAGITVPNPKSLRFHERFGFTHVARYRQAGYKLGQWHDVDWLEYQIQPVYGVPAEPTRFDALPSVGE